MSRNPITQMAMSNDWLTAQGLVSIKEQGGTFSLLCFNRLVRTRMLGSVGEAGVMPALTRLGRTTLKFPEKAVCLAPLFVLFCEEAPVDFLHAQGVPQTHAMCKARLFSGIRNLGTGKWLFLHSHLMR